MISVGPAIGSGGALPDRNAFTEVAGPQDAHHSRVQLISAMVYAIGITLGAVGCVGAFLWAPLLWCAMAGLVVIAAAFIIDVGQLGGSR